MEITDLKQTGTWIDALDAARVTIGKKPLNKEPSDKWKRQMCLARHSPLRIVEYSWMMRDVPQWVTVHFVRYGIGILKFVRTQRDDRRSDIKDRSKLPQGALNDMLVRANAETILHISHQRLCSKASKETRELWQLFVDKLKEIDPILASKCVPNCIFQGFCPEMKSCGYADTDNFKQRIKEYRRKQ